LNTIRLSYPLHKAQLPDAYHSGGGHVIAIGAFDGVHLGHRNVIAHAKQIDEREKLPVTILTFHPHPKEVLGQHKYASYLTPIDDKLALLADMSVDNACVFTFDEPFSRVSPGQFIESVLLPLRPHTVVIGFDFHFGHKGEGKPELLQSLGQGRFAVDIVPAYYDGDQKVSSSLIRESLAEGDVGKARYLLGRSYRISGEVVQGHARGRMLGFPTANLSIDAPYVMPRTGVYAVQALISGTVYNGVLNLGYKPTFNDSSPGLVPEVHIFDFDGNLYGSRLAIDFIAFLREERKFASVDELIAQIRNDSEHARRLLPSANPGHV